MVKDCTDWLVPEPKGCSSTPDPPAAVPDVTATSFTVYEAVFFDFCWRATFLEAERSACPLPGCRSSSTGGRLATQPMLASLVILLDDSASQSGVPGAALRAAPRALTASKNPSITCMLTVPHLLNFACMFAGAQHHTARSPVSQRSAVATQDRPVELTDPAAPVQGHLANLL
jgi:hypothetical protein